MWLASDNYGDGTYFQACEMTLCLLSIAWDWKMGRSSDAESVTDELLLAEHIARAVSRGYHGARRRRVWCVSWFRHGASGQLRVCASHCAGAVAVAVAVVVLVFVVVVVGCVKPTKPFCPGQVAKGPHLRVRPYTSYERRRVSSPETGGRGLWQDAWGAM